MNTKVGIFLIVFFSSLCAQIVPQGTDNAADSLSTLRLGVVGHVDEAPLFVAYIKGYYKREKVNIDLIRLQTGGEEAAARAGSIDIMLVNYKFIPAISYGLPVRIISSLFFSTKPESRCFFILLNTATASKKASLKPFFAATLSGVEWISYNPNAAAELLIDKKYLKGSAEDISEHITEHTWNISGSDARENVREYLKTTLTGNEVPDEVMKRLLYQTKTRLSPYNEACCLVEFERPN